MAPSLWKTIETWFYEKNHEPCNKDVPIDRDKLTQRLHDIDMRQQAIQAKTLREDMRRQSWIIGIQVPQGGTTPCDHLSCRHCCSPALIRLLRDVLQVPNDLLPQLLVKCQNEGVKVGWLGSMDQRNTVFRDMTVDKVGFVLSFELVPDEEEEEKVSLVPH
jgi:hypothetical protein